VSQKTNAKIQMHATMTHHFKIKYPSNYAFF